MIRNLKTLGLAITALFAVSAMVASTAAAQQGKLTSDGPFTLTGAETGVGANSLTAFGLKLECPGSSYTGHKYNETPHKFIASGSTTVTVTPHFNQAKCVATPGNFPFTIDLNGCDYVTHLGATTGGVAGTYALTFDIVCPAGQEITTTTFTNETALTENKPYCVMHIPPQTGLSGAHTTDTANGFVDTTGPVKGIKVTRTKSATHALLCPEGTTLTGELDIDITGSVRNEAGGATAISVSE
jgi:hypothetical protein